MKTVVIRWLAVMTGVVALIAVAFNLYGNLLLDYSLDSLENALAITETGADDSNPLEQNVYKNFVQGLAMDELAKDNPNLSEMVVLDLASRSLGEAVERAGNKRAEIYLSEVQRQRILDRSPVLQLLDRAYYLAREFYQSLLSVWDYLGRRLMGASEEGREAGSEYSSVFILAQAAEKEKGGSLQEAAELYIKFLGFYPKHERYGFASLALGNIFIRQNRLEEALEILRPMKKKYLGTAEGAMAQSLIDRIGLVRDRLTYIQKMEELLSEEIEDSQAEKLRFQIAVAQFSIYRFEAAEKTLLALTTASSTEIRRKATFYLGWLYKLQGSLKQSEKILLGLVESPDLADDLKLSLHVELADVYYLMNNPEKAEEHFEVVSGGTNQALKTLEIKENIWRAVSEIERANIHFYDYRNAEDAESTLGDFREEDIFGFNQARGGNPGDLIIGNVRDAAFRSLARGKIDVAFDLFQKNLSYFPGDPWTHSALGSLYLLFGEFEKAEEYALKAYDWQQDEYTTSALAYVYGYLEKHEDAIGLYNAALEMSPDYLTAQYNLACLHLEVGNYNEALKLLTEVLEGLTYREKYMRSKVLNNMGYALWWLGVPEQSEFYFKRALKETPEFALAQTNLERMQSQEAPEKVTFKGLK